LLDTKRLGFVAKLFANDNKEPLGKTIPLQRNVIALFAVVVGFQ
jgi:hypothetical protein